MRRIGVTLGVVVAASSLGAVALAAQPPQRMLASVLRNARAQHSVHYVSWGSEGAPGHLSVTADVGRGRGVAHLTETFGKRSSSITVIVVGDTAYVRGGKRGLEEQAFLSRAKAARYAGQWISVPKGAKDYEYLVGGVTLLSLLHSIAPAPHSRVKEASTTFKGRQAIEIRAIASDGVGETTFVLRPGGRLPIEAGYVAAGGMGSTTLSRWNERLRVRAPAHAVPIATIRR